MAEDMCVLVIFIDFTYCIVAECLVLLLYLGGARF
jgi:hypothetical protein